MQVASKEVYEQVAYVWIGELRLIPCIGKQVAY